MENSIVFEVDMKAERDDVKSEVERLFGVKVAKVNILITPKGKRAVVRLAKGSKAEDITTKLKMA